jgi:hypothetical protein
MVLQTAYSSIEQSIGAAGNLRDAGADTETLSNFVGVDAKSYTDGSHE